MISALRRWNKIRIPSKDMEGGEFPEPLMNQTRFQKATCCEIFYTARAGSRISALLI